MTIRNSKPLALHIPAPRARPGEAPDFRDVVIPEAGVTPRPAMDTDAAGLRDMAFGLVRVLDMAGRAHAPWDPRLDVARLRRGMEVMLVTRAFDRSPRRRSDRRGGEVWRSVASACVVRGWRP